MIIIDTHVWLWLSHDPSQLEKMILATVDSAFDRDEIDLL
jgi:PIN domain nuclease of toxin-antitoxin system